MKQWIDNSKLIVLNIIVEYKHIHKKNILQLNLYI